MSKLKCFDEVVSASLLYHHCVRRIIYVWSMMSVCKGIHVESDDGGLSFALILYLSPSLSYLSFCVCLSPFLALLSLSLSRSLSLSLSPPLLKKDKIEHI